MVDQKYKGFFMSFSNTGVTTITPDSLFTTQVASAPRTEVELAELTKLFIQQRESLENSLWRSHISHSLSPYQFRQICQNDQYFKNDSLNSSTSLFSDLSFKLVAMLDKADQVKKYTKELSDIFQNRFSDLQIKKHLSNLIQYTLWEAETQKKALKIIPTQLSLLSVSKMMEATRSSLGDSNHFIDRFWLSLKTANLFEDIVDESSWYEGFTRGLKNFQEKFSEIIEIFTEESKNLIVAQEMLSTESPTSIFEAQGTVMSHNTQYQMCALAASVGTAVLGPAYAAYATVSFLYPTLSTIARKIYLRFLRKTPLAIPPLTDYSKKSKHSYSKTFIGREEVIQSILRIWKQNKHPILVGPPGVGKTALITELGKRIAMNQLPGFEGKTLFGASAVLLSGTNIMGPPAFQRVVKSLNKYRDNVILALDEAHALTKDNLTMLRTATDNSSESLRYCLFATTPDGYESFENDESLRRRLVKIDIPSLGKIELLYLLHEEAKLTFPMLTIEDEAMEILYDKMAGKQNETRQLLHKVLLSADAQNTSFQALEKRHVMVFKIHSEKHSYRYNNFTPEKQLEYAEKIQKDLVELEKLDKECIREDNIRMTHVKLLEYLQKSKDKCLLYAKQIYNSIVNETDKDASETDRIKRLTDVNFITKNEIKLKELLFLQFFDIPQQIENIKKFEKNHGLVSVINKDILNVFLEKIQNAERATRDSTTVTPRVP